MSFQKKAYQDIVNDIISVLTHGIIKEKHEFKSNKIKYKLRNSPVKDIVKIEGLINNTRSIFQKDIDYRLSGEMLEWLKEGKKPDDQTIFFINYIVGDLNNNRMITDVNPGSVIRNIVESISREIDFLYSQIEQVYLSGFLDTANGNALDLVVALLGVERKSPQFSTGKVTFGRNTAPEEILLDSEIYVFDGSNKYELKTIPVKKITKIEGISEGSPYVFISEKDYTLEGDSIVWLADGKKPDTNSEFIVSYSAYKKITIPKGITVSTFSREIENVKTFTTIEEGVLSRNQDGKWEAEVSIKASVPGNIGNVLAGSITVMPKPPIGIEYVMNRNSTMGGTEAENDSELRERAKRALERVGKATLISIESAVRSVEGVRSLLIEDSPDGISGIVKIIVQGGDIEELKRVIDETRAAGIKVELLRPKIVLLDLNITISLEKEFSGKEIKGKLEDSIRNYFSNLKIGEDVLFNKIIFVILSIEGIKDILDINIDLYRNHSKESIKENIPISNDELVDVRRVNVYIKE